MAKDRMSVRLMAGEAPMLIECMVVNWRNQSLFADCLPLIEANPRFTDEEWIMDAFCALVNGNGALLAFPTHINYSLASANSKIPKLYDLLEGIDTITFDDLLMHYISSGGLDSGLSLMTPNAAILDLLWFSEAFIDFDSGFVNFQSPEFVERLKKASEIIIKAEPVQFRMTIEERPLHDAERYAFIPVCGMIFHVGLGYIHPTANLIGKCFCKRV